MYAIFRLMKSKDLFGLSESISLDSKKNDGIN